MFFKIRFDNGYSGCTNTCSMEFGSLEEAAKWAREELENYGACYEFVAEGYSTQFGWEDEDCRARYYSNLSFFIEEADAKAV